MIFKRPLLSIVIILLLFLIFNVIVDTNLPYVNNLVLESEKLPQGRELRILQISDLHGREFGEGESYLLKLAKRSKPDITVLTGDYCDVGTTDFTGLLGFADELSENSQLVCFVPGNHEQGNRDSGILYNGLEAAGVKLLFDTGLVYSSKGFSINICGIDFPFEEARTGRGDTAERTAVSKALKGMDGSRYTILLSHSPDIADTVTGRQVDLVLSGHTHGGQIRIPFIGSLQAFDRDFFGNYDRGLFKLKSGVKLYVNSGLGTSILPIRFCDRAEMTLIKLRALTVKEKS